MSGYTPLFGSLTTGTLCGRWPDIGLWPIVLSLSDRNGVVDVTCQYLSTVTGLVLSEVTACMQRFCQADPGSRSSAADGARLELLDSHRDWGWRIVNHGTYRERARKQAWDAERTASGRDAERKRVSRAVPTRPDCPRSQTQTQTQTKNGSKSARARATPPKPTDFPEDFPLDERMRSQALSRAADCDVEQAFEQFRAHYVSHGKKLKNWRMAWVTWVGNFEKFGYPKRKACAPGMEGVKWQ